MIPRHMLLWKVPGIRKSRWERIKKPSSQIGRRLKGHRYTTYSVRRLSPFILPSCNGKAPARSTDKVFDLQLKSDFPSIRYSHPASTVPNSLCLSADVYSLSQRLFVLWIQLSYSIRGLSGNVKDFFKSLIPPLATLCYFAGKLKVVCHLWC